MASPDPDTTAPRARRAPNAAATRAGAKGAPRKGATGGRAQPAPATSRAGKTAKTSSSAAARPATTKAPTKGSAKAPTKAGAKAPTKAGTKTTGRATSRREITEEPGRLRRGLTLAQRRTQRREDLLAAAVELFGTKGYAATSIDELCRSAYVSTRNFYEEFTGREAVLDALLDRIANEVFDAISTAEWPTDVDDLVVADTRVRVEAVGRVLLSDPRKARIALIEAPTATPDKALWRQRYDRALVGYLLEHFRDVLRQIDEPLVASVEDYVNPTTQYYIAQSVVGAVSQILTDWVLRPDKPPIQEPIDHCVFAVLRLVSLRGIPEMLERVTGVQEPARS
jgi:AcrR family transcriptional regulator